MKISPYDIQNKEFKVEIFSGFDKEEVKSYMEAIREQMEEILKENDLLRGQIQTLDSQLMEYKKIDALMRETLHRMQTTAEQYETNAKAQAEAIIKEAEQQAKDRLLQSKKQINRLKEEVSSMKATRRRFNEEIGRYLQSQREILQIEDAQEYAPQEEVPVTIDTR